MSRTVWSFILLISVALVCGDSRVPASQVQLDVSMAQPTLLSEKKQTTFVKVGLTGFKLSGTAQRAPANISLVLDKSGSMTGEKIAKAREAAIAAIGRLNAKDIVSVITYDSTVQIVVPATKLTDKRAVCNAIRRIEAGGSTALFAGVSKGAAELRKFLSQNRVNRIILLSDGLANVGPRSPSELGNLGASLMKEGISVSTLGLGLDFNEDLMTQLAGRGGGNHMFIEKAGDLARVFDSEFDDVLSVVAQELAIQIQVTPGIRPVRVLNMDAEIVGQQVIVKMNQLYSEQERYALLEVEVPPTAAGKTRQIAEVTATYANMQTKTTDRLSSTVSANFSPSVAEVQAKTERDVEIARVLLIANERNKLATALRDKGDVQGAHHNYVINAQILAENAEKLNSDLLRDRCRTNYEAAQNAGSPEWKKYRKLQMRFQHLDESQQRY